MHRAPDKRRVAYQVFAEAVTPGIAKDDVHSIFEEHFITHHLRDLGTRQMGFAIKDETFSFGFVAARVRGLPQPTATVACDPWAPAAASLKFTNPHKVSWYFSTLNLEV